MVGSTTNYFISVTRYQKWDPPQPNVAFLFGDSGVLLLCCTFFFLFLFFINPRSQKLFPYSPLFCANLFVPLFWTRIIPGYFFLCFPPFCSRNYGPPCSAFFSSDLPLHFLASELRSVTFDVQPKRRRPPLLYGPLRNCVVFPPFWDSFASSPSPRFVLCTSYRLGTV